MNRGFINAYKAAGAYYTMKDLIMFEGCRFMDGASKDDSLKFLDKIVEDIDGRINTAGYVLLGALKQFTNRNDFDYVSVKNKWLVQSKNRKIAKKLMDFMK